MWYKSESAVGHKFSPEKESSVSRFYKLQGNVTTGRKINRNQQLYIHVISSVLSSESLFLFQQNNSFTNSERGLIAADMIEYICEYFSVPFSRTLQEEPSNCRPLLCLLFCCCAIWRTCTSIIMPVGIFMCHSSKTTKVTQLFWRQS